MVAFINQMVAEIGKPKFEYEHAAFDQELFDNIVAELHGRGQGCHGHRRQERPRGSAGTP